MEELPALPAMPAAIADLLDILPDAVVVVDARGRVAYTNPAIRNLLGYLRDELIGQPLSVLVPPADRDRHASLVGTFLLSDTAASFTSRRPSWQTTSAQKEGGLRNQRFSSTRCRLFHPSAVRTSWWW